MELINAILGHIGNVFFLGGVYSLGKKKMYGWYSNILGNLLYAIQAYLMNNTPLIWLSVGLIILNFKGAWEWKNAK